FCGACGNNRTNRGGFQFAAARLPWFIMSEYALIIRKAMKVVKTIFNFCVPPLQRPGQTCQDRRFV
ncbi:hypothetical protein, partial [Klebsiella pneumoniae]|uniref:hypothetical protein n=1 Tax=Klebsiella pneumoniae TaxID=573 RepID=UPI001A9F3FE1